MQVFTDNRKRNWTVVINVAAVRRVRAMLDVDLMDAIGGGFVKKLSANPALLCNLLYVLCENEAAGRRVPDHKFGAALVGDCSIAAYCAFFSELVAFFPEAEKEIKTESHQPTTDDRSTLCTPEDCWSLVWQHAGILGIDPGPFSLRELCLMARARKKDEWSRTSALIAKIHNMFCDPKVSQDYFNPFVSKKEEAPAEEERIPVENKFAFRLMKDFFVGGKK